MQKSLHRLQSNVSKSTRGLQNQLVISAQVDKEMQQQVDEIQSQVDLQEISVAEGEQMIADLSTNIKTDYASKADLATYASKGVNITSIDGKMCIQGTCISKTDLDRLRGLSTGNVPDLPAHPDNRDGSMYRADGQVQIAVDDLVRLRHTGSKQTGVQFSVYPGAGDIQRPNGVMKISRQGIMFGGNNINREVNSAQISAGTHIKNSLNIVGMASDKTAGTRRIDMWGEKGTYIHGPLCVGDTCITKTDLDRILQKTRA